MTQTQTIPTANGSAPGAKVEKPEAAPIAPVIPSKATKKVTTANVKEIHVDYSFNCRSQARTQLKGSHLTDDDPESPGVEGLAESMATSGQDTPVDVVAVKGGFELRAGFRRYTAAKLLFSEGRTIAGLGKDEIRITVWEGLTKIEERLLNFRENVGGRESLTPPDLVYGMLQLKELPQTEIAARLGKSQPYVSRLLRIGTGLKPTVLNAWRSAPAPLALLDMWEIAQKKPEEQDAEYASRCTPVAEDPALKEWVKNAQQRAAKTGALLGELHREGMIVVGAKAVGDADEVEIVDPDLALFTLYIRNLCKFKIKEAGGKDVSKTKLKSIADAAYRAFNAQLEAKPTESTEETE